MGEGSEDFSSSLEDSPSSELASPRLSPEEGAQGLPEEELLLLADSIIQRLQPEDRHEMQQMTVRFGLASGILMMVVALFWWLAVKTVGDSWGDVSTPASVVLDLSFAQVSWIVPLLVFLATVVYSLAREQGGPVTAFIGGLFYVLAVYLAVEPIGFLMFDSSSSVSLSTAFLQTIRLVALGVMVHYSARFFLDAVLLAWVRNLLTNFPVDLHPPPSQKETTVHETTPDE